jgi:hypothetical protein
MSSDRKLYAQVLSDRPVGMQECCSAGTVIGPMPSFIAHMLKAIGSRAGTLMAIHPSLTIIVLFEIMMDSLICSAGTQLMPSVICQHIGDTDTFVRFDFFVVI